MNFKDYSSLRGQHAFLSPSNYHWINYDENKLVQRYETVLAAQRGTELHEFAQMAISHGIKLQRSQRTLNMYVNDAIGYRMVPEQILYYSPNCFGTADAISFSEKKRFLRIHDFKSGETPASMDQIKVYVALFCLDYGYSPFDFDSDLRIYQFNTFVSEKHDPDEIAHIQDKIITFDKVLDKLKATGEL